MNEVQDHVASASADPKVDELQAEVQRVVQQAAEKPREQLFKEVWALAHAYLERPTPPVPIVNNRAPSAELSEPWYCCAEPTEEQFAVL